MTASPAEPSSDSRSPAVLFKNNRVSWLQGNYGSHCKRYSKMDLYRKDGIAASRNLFKQLTHLSVPLL